MLPEKNRKRRGGGVPDALVDFLEDELISRVVRVVKSGKEATVYCCEGGPSVGGGYLAGKVYRSREGRGFQNDAVYQEGRVVLDGRIRRAMEKKTRKGRETQFSMWIGHEFATLSTLHAAGADVPRPVACGESAILIEFLGDEGIAAPPLHTVELSTPVAQRLFEQVVRNVELCLSENVIHGDLSPYNILVVRPEERTADVRIIDFPQAVDPRYNSTAFELLLRDLENVYEFFALSGVRARPRELALAMWERQVSIPVGERARR